MSKRLEKLERDFLWEGPMEERKYHLVNWDIVCSNLREGGLGIKNLIACSDGYWVWRFMVERNAL